jgi:hypothetical protein
MRWSLRELAEADVRHFNRGITINQEFQRPYMLKDFQIEEVEDGFVVWCEGPFVVRGSGEVKSPVHISGSPELT